MVSGSQMLATHLLIHEHCNVGPPLFRFLCPTHPTDLFGLRSEKFEGQCKTQTCGVPQAMLGPIVPVCFLVCCSNLSLNNLTMD